LNSTDGICIIYTSFLDTTLGYEKEKMIITSIQRNRIEHTTQATKSYERLSIKRIKWEISNTNFEETGYKLDFDKKSSPKKMEMLDPKEVMR